jgi:hypothetical protein
MNPDRERMIKRAGEMIAAPTLLAALTNYLIDEKIITREKLYEYMDKQVKKENGS